MKKKKIESVFEELHFSASSIRYEKLGVMDPNIPFPHYELCLAIMELAPEFSSIHESINLREGFIR